ncbi:hypothetical protein Pmar_PMAR019975 [Perkinsus marinus ATCC 50983]|uniref:Uncharacterized protein n=1 Tax=Perkinsus marinus (strain ATCC 50983 / TXsc) TaxID=423536 RepID=C5LJ82_PERM5|nr:hypothetical protein Pmar_PMAR019975 [Perkinsus marinus ATCC 50983]EER03198.1 hypothetical protein Pmar_PMAR019975 [Perkinsus marinus ATCC 50983]|eukprot:XP_002771382.1 hypothetical protein Pmar_PMAR019975 [Perkinsus marinus ATCC 50983]
MLSAATALVTMAVLAGYGVVTGVDASLKPGKYCAYQDVFSPTPGMMLRGCMFFQYDSPGEAIVGYNYFGIHYYAFRYDSAVIKDNTFILKRFGRSEGPEIYPYYEVGFDLKVPPGSAEVVQMVSKKGDYVHNLTMTACENPKKYDAACVAIPYAVSAPDGSLTSDEETPTGLYDNRIGPHDVSTYFRAKDSLARISFRDWRSPLGQSSAIYNSGTGPMKLSKARCGELIQLDNFYKTKQFVNVPAQWFYFSYDNTVEFVPNNKSKPSVVLIHLPKVSKK